MTTEIAKACRLIGMYGAQTLFGIVDLTLLQAVERTLAFEKAHGLFDCTFILRHYFLE